VHDNLSNVLDHATLVGQPTTASGTASVSGTTLTWDIPLLDNSAQVSYTVQVDADASGVTLRNHATPASPGGMCVYVGACSTEQVVPKLTKTFVAATQHMVNGQWDGTWDVVYQVTETNPSTDEALSYTLNDTPGYPADVTVNSASVTKAVDSTGAMIVAINTWNGTELQIVANKSLAAGVTDTYTVLVNATVPPDEASGQCTTKPGGGFYNASTADVSPAPVEEAGFVRDPSFTASACGPIPSLPAVHVTKSVTSTTQNPDGTWTIDYVVKVTDPGTLASMYNLSDTLRYGGGISIDSASVTGPGASNTWDGVSDTTVATGRYISASSSVDYAVSVTATVSAKATATDRDCTLTTTETGTGFLNAATASTGNKTSEGQACSEPVSPTVTKTFVKAVGTGGGSYDVTYTIAVQDPAATTGLVYGLTDAPAFPAGVTVNSAKVTKASDSTGATIVAVNSWTNGTLTIAKAKKLAAGVTDTYTIVVGATVADSVPSAARTCDNTTSGHGFDNTATAASGSDTFTASACGTIPPKKVTIPTGDPAQHGPSAVEMTIGSGLLAAGLLAGLVLYWRRRRLG
ncbi:MAG: hypothetical protein ACRDQ1_03840, partial [Sciscionella sp.]